jgi:hypothetical protein
MEQLMYILCRERLRRLCLDYNYGLDGLFVDAKLQIKLE